MRRYAVPRYFVRRQKMNSCGVQHRSDSSRNRLLRPIWSWAIVFVKYRSDVPATLRRIVSILETVRPLPIHVFDGTKVPPSLALVNIIRRVTSITWVESVHPLYPSCSRSFEPSVLDSGLLIWLGPIVPRYQRRKLSLDKSDRVYPPPSSRLIPGVY